MISDKTKLKLKGAKKICVLTGAGISAESGIPTFRGSGGLWKNFRAEDLATPDAFRRNPSLVWEWYHWRRNICKNANPNLAHFVIAEMEKHYSSFLLVTQNVDGLHPRAGSKRLLEIHGNIFTARCLKCETIFPIEDKEYPEHLVYCPKCASLSRPHIVWFGESYDVGILEEIYSYTSNIDIVIIIGTSGQVSVPVQIALNAINRGAYSIEINPDESTISNNVDEFIKGKAGEILPSISQLLQE